jgi:hypothetical protein
METPGRSAPPLLACNGVASVADHGFPNAALLVGSKAVVGARRSCHDRVL